VDSRPLCPYGQKLKQQQERAVVPRRRSLAGFRALGEIGANRVSRPPVHLQRSLRIDPISCSTNGFCYARPGRDHDLFDSRPLDPSAENWTVRRASLSHQTPTCGVSLISSTFGQAAKNFRLPASRASASLLRQVLEQLLVAVPSVSRRAGEQVLGCQRFERTLHWRPPMRIAWESSDGAAVRILSSPTSVKWQAPQ
jgi:hypothetical protein